MGRIDPARTTPDLVAWPMATFTLTCIGDDRPGLVSALSAPINAHGASWERSQMARLAGKFAGILMVAVPDDQAEALVAELSAALAAQGIGIEELSTDVREAPMSGGMLFEASAVLEAPPATSMQELRSMLEAVADELMVEIRLSDTPPSTRPNGH